MNTFLVMIELISKDKKYCRQCFVMQSQRVHYAWPYTYMFILNVNDLSVLLHIITRTVLCDRKVKNYLDMFYTVRVDRLQFHT